MSNHQIPDDIQRAQTAYRRRILDTWNIPSGARILEVGCGQGDMTAVLAEAVGETGHVTATDIASPDYGAPLTLGQATDLIKASLLGERIDFHFNCDVTNPEFKLGQFDFAVMAHCSWYFASKDQLMQTFSALAEHAKCLCFAEWNSFPMGAEKVPHQVAVLIQAQIERYKTDSQSNIRTPFTMEQLMKMMSESGWKVVKSGLPSTAGLQDADWEINECLTNSLEQARSLNIPGDVLDRLTREIDYLRSIALPSGNVPLSSMAFLAERER